MVVGGHACRSGPFRADPKFNIVQSKFNRGFHDVYFNMQGGREIMCLGVLNVVFESNLNKRDAEPNLNEEHRRGSLKLDGFQYR
jgi:hypothetical protein